MRNKVISPLITGIVLVSLIGVTAACATSAVRVATTTSLYDTELWGYLEPMFEERYNVELDIMYAGTGKALEYGRRGDADVIVVHSPAREEQFVAQGYGVERVPFAYNYFLIVGPETDPAGIKDLNPGEAFTRLREEGEKNPEQVQFVSRGDDSGTHEKEKAIWNSIGYDHVAVQEFGRWYLETGSGMGPTLLMATEKQAYTLTDMGTFLAYRGNIDLVPVADSGDILLNVYSAITINQGRHPQTKIDLANNLISFLTSPEIQELIGNYGVEEYGTPLFTPCAGAEPN
jgi:tungstate transport system substrate-binding protein